MNYSVAFMALYAPLIFTALVVILLIALRWFSYKERMAQISQGLPLEEKPKKEKHKTLLATGLILGLLGIALTIGLVTLGIGPWLLAGLLPLFAGLALILTSLVLQPAKEKVQEEAPVPDTFTEAAEAASTTETIKEETPEFAVDKADEDEELVEETKDEPFLE